MPLRSSLVVVVISAVSLLLWLSLLFFSFHEGGLHPVNSGSASNTLVPRKVLLDTVKFDASTFHSTRQSINDHHHHHHHHHPATTITAITITAGTVICRLLLSPSLIRTMATRSIHAFLFESKRNKKPKKKKKKSSSY
ncbi:hypothetical protein ACMD2_23027 [Ananas comosus]|uniref:Uncharacterized protein n=1 Tax=Ananas comosus TaxID=4615 RepID=A0A199VKM8_ANACO|nr:hypothetical protein ACMD2_23027 [Ananas comosus]